MGGGVGTGNATGLNAGSGVMFKAGLIIASLGGGVVRGLTLTSLEGCIGLGTFKVLRDSSFNLGKMPI
jgi:hypothetical protein